MRLKDYPASRIALIKPSVWATSCRRCRCCRPCGDAIRQAHIAWLVNRSYKPLLRGHPDLDEVLPFDRGATRHGLWQATLNYARFLRDIRARGFDLVDRFARLTAQRALHHRQRSAAAGRPQFGARGGGLVLYRPGARCRLQHDSRGRSLLAGGRGAGRRRRADRISPADPRTGAAWAMEELHDCPRPWLAFGVGSRWVTKRWPTDHFASPGSASPSRVWRDGHLRRRHR